MEDEFDGVKLDAEMRGGVLELAGGVGEGGGDIRPAFALLLLACSKAAIFASLRRRI